MNDFMENILTRSSRQKGPVRIFDIVSKLKHAKLLVINQALEIERRYDFKVIQYQWDKKEIILLAGWWNIKLNAMKGYFAKQNYIDEASDIRYT